jgi:hypothetical protein
LWFYQPGGMWWLGWTSPSLPHSRLFLGCCFLVCEVEQMAHPLYPLSARFPQELRPSCFSRCSPISITENFYFFYHQKGTEIGDGHQPEGPAGTVDVIRDVQQQSLSFLRLRQFLYECCWDWGWLSYVQYKRVRV